jgi:hypothetical protein
MKVRVALWAPRIPPETGASKKRAGEDESDDAWTAEPTSREVEVSIVELGKAFGE